MALISRRRGRLLCLYSVSSDSAIPWPVARQAPRPWQEFSRQEYWSGVPVPTPGIKPRFLRLPHWQVESLAQAPTGKPKGRVRKLSLTGESGVVHSKRVWARSVMSDSL